MRVYVWFMAGMKSMILGAHGKIEDEERKEAEAEVVHFATVPLP